MATIIRSGKLKFLGGGYHRGEWEEAELNLHSDATLEVVVSVRMPKKLPAYL